MGNWSISKEPETPILDSWGRSSIKIKKMIRPKIINFDTRPTSAGKKSEAVKSIKSRLSLKKNITKNFSNEQLDNKKISPIKEIVTIPLETTLIDEDPHIDTLRKQKERDIKRKKEEQEKHRLKQIDEEEQKKRLAKIQQELKTKEWTHDHTGNIIFVQSVKPDKLPPSTYQMNYDVKNFMEHKKINTKQARKKSSTQNENLNKSWMICPPKDNPSLHVKANAL